jgi:hypothetical protein
MLLAPYLAVIVFWSGHGTGLSSAWLSILAYHAQILFWARDDLRAPRWPQWQRPRALPMLTTLPAIAAGPALYLLAPYVASTDLAQWLTAHGLSGAALLLMIPYFGFVHPVLEQIHWRPLREQTWISHPVFAGYHMIVLSSILEPPYLLLCFVVLVSASLMWLHVQRMEKSLNLAVLAHSLADFGIVVAAWLRTLG